MSGRGFVLPKEKTQMIMNVFYLNRWRCLFYIYRSTIKGEKILRKDIIEKLGDHNKMSASVSKTLRAFNSMGLITIVKPVKENGVRESSYMIQLTPMGKKVGANIYDIVKTLYDINLVPVPSDDKTIDSRSEAIII